MGEVEKFQSEDIETTWRRAKGYALSGYFADAKSAEQAFVKITAGAEMGLTPFQSMSGIHIISGKPVVGAGLLAAMLDQHPDYDYGVKWDPDFETATACTITVWKNGKERGESRFSIDDAERAGLLRKGGMYDKFPPNMLYARAMSNAVRFYAPGVTGTSTYVEGEIPTFEAPRQEHATPKPRTRVTAEVVPEEVPPADVELDYDPVTTPALSVQLRALSLQDRADLYELVGISKGTPLASVREKLIGAAKGYELEDEGEPNAAAILAVAKQVRRDALPSDAVDAFQHFADTGQDLSDDPQTALA